jgi:3-hydroxyisobutyrate dehydrogenase-like beta-hydroxyacid dehydrogenase
MIATRRNVKGDSTPDHREGGTAMQPTQPEGFVGLGAMGSRLAGRLLDAGHQVCANTRTPAKADRLIKRGAIWRATPREVAAEAEVVFSMVSDDSALLAVATGADGILAGLAPETVYVDISTVSPRVSACLARQVRALGALMLDAPVSGSLPQAQAGRVTIMVGGEAQAFHRVEPLLRELGGAVTHVGDNGHGLVLKLAVNISLAAQAVAFAEGLHLAQRSGVDRALAAEVMSNSPIASPMLQARVPLFLGPQHEPWFDLQLMHKDIALARAAAQRIGAPTPSATLADELLERARELGHEDRDIAALYDVIASGAESDQPQLAPSA